jgi:oligopeptide/dipeptide ABC transporter ATP-binding protein
VQYVCHRVAVTYFGQIVEEGSVEVIFRYPRHPYSQALISAYLFPDPHHRRVGNPVASALQGEISSPIDLPVGCRLASRCPHANAACRAAPQLLESCADGRVVRCHRVVAARSTREGGAQSVAAGA